MNSLSIDKSRVRSRMRNKKPIGMYINGCSPDIFNCNIESRSTMRQLGRVEVPCGKMK